MPQKKIAVVTGGNKGVGFAICRRLAEEGVLVVLTARSAKRGEAACRKLQGDGHDVRFHPLDVTEEDAPKKLAVFLEAEFGRLNILVNNAAILLDERLTALTIGTDSLRETMETNLYGPLHICQALAPLMKRNRHGRIVNVSSWYGSLKEMRGGGYAGYRISKAALNALTCILADDLRGTGILVNAACPGWVRTDMGGSGGPKSPEEGADTPVWLAQLPEGGPTGSFFQDRKHHPW